jgi:hypothetical protein
MFGMSRPGLRNHAVVSRVAILRFGQIWQVHDRRDPAIPKLLLVSHKSKPWPVLLERLAKYSVSPTRLRSGKVAILVSHATLADVKLALKFKPSIGLDKHDALEGFSALSRKTKPKRVLLATSVLAAVSLLVSVPQLAVQSKPLAKSTPEAKPAVVKCNGEIAVGMMLPSPLRKSGKVRLGEEVFVVSSVRPFGGLVLISAKRACDGKQYRLEAWQSQDSLEVSRVY